MCSWPTLEVFLRAETCVREPLNTSHSRQPSPHTSADLQHAERERERERERSEKG